MGGGSGGGGTLPCRHPRSRFPPVGNGPGPAWVDGAAPPRAPDGAAPSEPGELPRAPPSRRHPPHQVFDMRTLRPALATLALALALGVAGAGAQQPAPARQTKPIDPANLDTTCAACKDFYGFANGGWLKRNEIPAAYSQWGSFNELADRNNEALRLVLDDLARGTTAPTATTTKLATLYASCMDSAAVERAGATPIAGTLTRVSRIRDRAGVEAELAQLHNDAVQAGFGFFASPDQKRSG